MGTLTDLPDADRAALWLPLLQRLTAVAPHWHVWKNVDSALRGTGDIDAVAPPAEWPIIEREFRAWAAQRALGPVAVCRHIPGGVNLVCAPDGWDTLLEMGVKTNKVWRGVTLFTHEQLAPLVVDDPRGFRSLTPGAEGVLKLLLNGTRWDGRPNREGLRAKRVVEQLRADPEGARRAATALFGRAAAALVAGAERAAAGEWDRGAMLAVSAWVVGRGLRSPGVMARRLRFRASAGERCPVVAALADGRRVPRDREGWLRAVADLHPVTPATAAAHG